MVEQEIKELYNSHSKVWSLLSKIYRSGRIGSAYLFSGPQGSGKEAISLKFAQLINCEKKLEFPCNKCSSCRRFSQLQHENLNIILPLPTPKKSNNPKNFIDKKVVEIISNQFTIKSKSSYRINICNFKKS